MYAARTFGNGTFSDEKIALEFKEPEDFGSIDNEQADAMIGSMTQYVWVWNPTENFFSNHHDIPHFEGGGLSLNDFPIAFVKTYGGHIVYIFAAVNGIDEVQYTLEKKKQVIFDIASTGMNYSDRIKLSNK